MKTIPKEARLGYLKMTECNHTIYNIYGWESLMQGPCLDKHINLGFHDMEMCMRITALNIKKQTQISSYTLETSPPKKQPYCTTV